MKLSLIWYSYRPGSVDLIIESLKRQEYKGEWELIVVDDWKNDREKFFKESELPLRWYGKMKKKCYPDTPHNLANVINTGLLRVTGDIVVMVQDNAALYKNALEVWHEIFEKLGMDYVVSGCAVEHWYHGDFRVTDYSVFEPPYNGKDSSRFEPYHAWVPEEFELFYTGVPMEFFDRINGFDERSDYASSGFFYSLLEQIKLNGMRLHVDKRNMLNMVNHRNWEFLEGRKLWWLTARGEDDERFKNIKWDKVSHNCFNLKEERLRNARIS